MSATKCLLVLTTVVSGLVLPAAQADDWRWPARFTEASAPELTEIHSAIHDTDLGAAHLGVPVADKHFRAGSFDLHLVSGTIFQEPEVEGYPTGAFFSGQATISFAPDSIKARNDLQRMLGGETLTAVEIDFAYLFTLRGLPLARQLGVEAEPSVPFETSGAYATAKQAARQLGMELVAALLNREGRSRDAAYVLFAPEMIRTSGGADSHLLFKHDPAGRRPDELTVFGHSAAIRDPGARRFLERYPTYKYQFFPVAWTRRPEDSAFVPAADVEKYKTDLVIGRGTNVEARTTILLTPPAGSDALVFDLTTRLEVHSVTGPDGEALPFAQWTFLPDQPDFDETLVVHAPQRFRAGQPTEIQVISSGPLFDPGDALNRLADL